jgi:predicted ATPase/class 3 adenylate cyclase
MVTFLLTDIEGSMRKWAADQSAMRAAIELHDQIVTGTVEHHRGTVLTLHGEGDSIFAVFARAGDAVGAATAIQRSLAAQVWPSGIEALRVRMAIHSGEAGPPDYRGPAANRCGRLRACAHGGQVVLSSAAVDQAGTLPDGVSLLDLGEHRLRDMSRPERIFQLVLEGLLSTFPPLQSLGAFTHNLPVQLTSFIGRSREREELRRLLSEARLVTLTGPGGCGKTRLALQVAADSLEDHAGGAWFVGLASVSSRGGRDLLVQAVAGALGIREEPDQELLDTLVDRLRQKPILLLADNCEHLVASCAEVVAELLAACPGLRVLATSRELLNVQGEVVWWVPSLTLPDSDRQEDLADSEAVALFQDRASSARTGFAIDSRNAGAVARICTRLEGIPLAIELAAARMRITDPQEVLDRLHSRFRLLTGGGRSITTPHETLRAAIDWSYDLLTPPERLLFQRLSVFVGSWSLDAAEAVCSGDFIADCDVLDLLGRLVDKSLVVVSDGEFASRYGMLETLREYGAERLAHSGGHEAAGLRHLTYFLGAAEAADVAVGRRQEPETLRRLAEDYDNFAAALDTASRHDHEVLLRLAGSLAWLWAAGVQARDGRRWLREALALRNEPSATRAHALNGLAWLAWQGGDYSMAVTALQEAVGIYDLLGDELTSARLRNNLGAVAQHRGDFVSAIEHYESVLSVYRRHGERRDIAISLSNLGLSKTEAGMPEDGRHDLDEALSIVVEIDDKLFWPDRLLNCGINAVYRNDVAAARTFYRRSLELAREMNHPVALMSSLEGFALMAAVSEDVPEAVRLTAAVSSLRGQLHVPASAESERRHQRWLDPLREAADPELYAAAWRDGLAMTIDEAVDRALRLDGASTSPM